MTKHEKKQAAVRKIIAEQCDGVIADFAKRIGRSESYVARMLYPRGKEGWKGIGETMSDVITDAFNMERGSLAGESHPAAEVAPAIHDELDVEVLQMTIKSLVKALAANIPAAAPIFADHLENQARKHRPRPLSVKHGLLAQVLNIALPSRYRAEGDALPAKLRGSARKSS